MKHLYKKLASVAVMSATIFSTLATELRESVCYIKEVDRGMDTTKLNSLSSILKDNGYFTGARRVKDYNNTNFSGSGFVFKNSRGECVVMTNKHVVDEMKVVDIIFEDSNGKKKEYKKLCSCRHCTC